MKTTCQLDNLLVFIFIILFHIYIMDLSVVSCLGDLLNSGCAPVRVLTECRGIKCFKYQKKITCTHHRIVNISQPLWFRMFMYSPRKILSSKQVQLYYTVGG